MNSFCYTKDAIKERIRSYVYQAVHVDNEEIMDNSLIFREGYIDSMGFILMIVFIEKEFGVKTVDEDLTQDNFASINAITDYISNRLNYAQCVE
jgi:acyl carrier protein